MSMSKKSTIVGNIKRYRNKLGISQDKLSKRANLAFIRLQKLKQAQPSTLLSKQLKNSGCTRNIT